MPLGPANSSSPEIKPELLPEEPNASDRLLEEIQEKLTDERDARREDQFVFIVVSVLLLDVVFFTIMPSIGGPIALLVLELLILLPLARRMGMEEIAEIVNHVIGRVSDGIKGNSRD